MWLRTAPSHQLDEIAKRGNQLRFGSWSAFRMCGTVGLVSGVLLSLMLATISGLSPWLMAGVALLGILTFLGVAMVTKIVTDNETLVFYHQQFAILAVATAFLWLLDQPSLSYLDITALGLGAILACGRVGCFMVGCCHGRPHAWGVRYCQEHVDAGFTSYLKGVRLFPIQIVEAGWALCIVIVGVVLILRDQPAGSILAWYVMSYGIGRFSFEFLRGDPDRRYFQGFSEAQWTSLALMIGIMGASLTGLIPFQAWYIVATGAVAGCMIVVSVRWRRRDPVAAQLLHPRHIREIAEAVGTPVMIWREHDEHRTTSEIHVTSTSLGILISTGELLEDRDRIRHFTLSFQRGTMPEDVARRLGNLILQLRPSLSTAKIVQGEQGVFHLLMR